MNGKVGLEEIMAELDPVLFGEEYVFCSTADDPADPVRSRAFAVVRETEGVTLVLQRDLAERAGLSFEGVFRRITLNVHSSLQAVGLTAVVATTLADRGISANVVAGYFHDHVFVPAARANAALRAMEELT